ncbi:M23 family metallopeptidase [Kyrpidia sp.]|uniref:M23 family metallopeptidase n=1 Tax=Kyrpidia sp. TaxID=2073077 RepID=UPI00258544C4|nr:M23 family metallopeptidase [Kyrpidia sp.]MCL6575630.1 M23 family metallopeptidase [Kyrpidia sp.]
MDWDAVKRRRMARDAEEGGRVSHRAQDELREEWPRPEVDRISESQGESESGWSARTGEFQTNFDDRLWANWEDRFWSGRREAWSRSSKRRSRWRDVRPTDGLGLGGLAWQILGAAVLVGGVYVAFHQQGALSDRVKAVAEKALTEQTNWSNVSGWMQEVAADGLAIPVAGSQGGSVWSAPLSGTVVKDYSSDHPWVVLDGVPGAAAAAAGKGVVEQVDRKDPFGLYVVVNHGNRGKTLYGSLGDVVVKTGDYVYPGQALGHLSAQRPAQLLFGYIVNGRYADPHAVLDGKGR